MIGGAARAAENQITLPRKVTNVRNNTLVRVRARCLMLHHPRTSSSPVFRDRTKAITTAYPTRLSGQLSMRCLPRVTSPQQLRVLDEKERSTALGWLCRPSDRREPRCARYSVLAAGHGAARSGLTHLTHRRGRQRRDLPGWIGLSVKWVDDVDARVLVVLDVAGHDGECMAASGGGDDAVSPRHATTA